MSFYVIIDSKTNIELSSPYASLINATQRQVKYGKRPTHIEDRAIIFEDDEELDFIVSVLNKNSALKTKVLEMVMDAEKE